MSQEIEGLDADPWFLDQDLYTGVQLGLLPSREVLMVVNHEYGFRMTAADARRLAKRLTELAEGAATRLAR